VTAGRHNASALTRDGKDGTNDGNCNSEAGFVSVGRTGWGRPARTTTGRCSERARAALLHKNSVLAKQCLPGPHFYMEWILRE
jgi:hypothetical protein